MDLVQTVRKEGSRGGRGDFSWNDVKNSSRRENYLGHSVMAPVGRWQKNKDLSWYARGDGEGQQMSEEEARKAEIKKIKEAEEDAMARALGREPPPRASENANLTALGNDSRVQKAIKEDFDSEDIDATGKGVGFGGYAGTLENGRQEGDVLPGTARAEDSRSARELRGAERREQRRDGSEDRVDKRERHHNSRRHHHKDRHRRRHDESRSRSRERHRHRSRSRERRRERDYRPRSREWSRDRYDRPRAHGQNADRARSRSPRRAKAREGYRR